MLDRLTHCHSSPASFIMVSSCERLVAGAHETQVVLSCLTAAPPRRDNRRCAIISCLLPAQKLFRTNILAESEVRCCALVTLKSARKHGCACAFKNLQKEKNRRGEIRNNDPPVDVTHKMAGHYEPPNMQIARDQAADRVQDRFMTFLTRCV